MLEITLFALGLIYGVLLWQDRKYDREIDRVLEERRREIGIEEKDEVK